MAEVFVFVIIIVLIGCGSGVLNNYFKHQQKLREMNDDPELRSELDALRDRIEVLEKIVTDESHSLSREISQLERSA